MAMEAGGDDPLTITTRPNIFTPTKGKDEKGPRRRRGKQARMSMPMNTYSGPLSEPKDNNAALSRGGRRSSDFSNTSSSNYAKAGDYASTMLDDSSSDEEFNSEDAYEFPWWWFVMLCVPSVPGRLFGNALWSVIWPKLISDLAGYKYKALLSSILQQIGTIMGYSAPFMGAFSDQLPERYSKYMGRRRPFIIAGSFFGTISMLITYHAIYYRPVGPWNWILLFISSMVGSIGGCISGPAMSAIIPETIPNKQRGMMVMIDSWFNTIVNIGGSTIGYAVGEGYLLTIPQVWWINIICGPLMLFPVLLMCNSRAFTSCTWHGIWKPEKPMSRSVVRRYAMRAEKIRLQELAKGKKRSLARQVWEELIDFVQAFKDPNYRNLWCQGCMGCVAGIMEWQFEFFWYQDCFPFGYTVFGYKVASNVISALSLRRVIDEVLHIFIMPCVRPDWWREKMGGRNLLVWFPMLGAPMVGSYLRWWWNGTPYVFTQMIIGSLWWSIFGCAGTAAGGALMMDCLPADEYGQPLAAARDMNLHAWAWRIPETGFPVLIAASMTWFPSHLAFFNYAFIFGGTLGNISWFMFITSIHPQDEPLDHDFQALRHYFCPNYIEYDAKRRLGLVGPERNAIKVAEVQEKEAKRRLIEDQVAALGPLVVGQQSSPGMTAVICDKLLFNKPKRSIQEDGTQVEQEPLLSSPDQGLLDGRVMLGEEGSGVARVE